VRIFLTGATGFVGRNLLLALLRDERVSWVGAGVRHGGKLVTQLAGEGIFGLPAKLQVVTGNAQDWGLGSVEDPPDFCVHLAGVLFARTREEYFSANVEGALRLWRELPPSTKMIVVSSQSAVGPGLFGGPARREEDAPAPVSFYGESKLAMEEALLREAGTGGRLLILRPPMVLGPRDSATLPLFQMVRGWPWVKPGSKTKQLSWIAAKDLVRAIARTWQPEGGALWSEPDPRFFVSAGETITDRTLLVAAGRVLGRQAPILPLPDALLRVVAGLSGLLPVIGENVPSLMPDRARELLAVNWTIDSGKFRARSEWSDLCSLAETLQETAAFFQKEGSLK
jgi:nucleoside-diphosphate-sugar epimerase